MASQNPLLDDLAGLMTGAMGAARSAGEEVRTLVESQMARFVADMDLVKRDELDAVRAQLDAALARIEALETAIAAPKAGN